MIEIGNNLYQVLELGIKFFGSCLVLHIIFSYLYRVTKEFNK